MLGKSFPRSSLAGNTNSSFSLTEAQNVVIVSDGNEHPGDNRALKTSHSSNTVTQMKEKRPVGRHRID